MFFKVYRRNEVLMLAEYGKGDVSGCVKDYTLSDSGAPNILPGRGVYINVFLDDSSLLPVCLSTLNSLSLLRVP